MQEVFNRYINYLQAERNASPYTVRNYVNDLVGNYARGPEKGFFQFLKLRKIGSLNEVDHKTIRAYIAWLMEQDIARGSIARKLSAIRSLFRYMTREGIIPANPLKKASSPKQDRLLPDFLTVEETVRLLEAPDLTKPTGQRDRALLEMLYASGLRVSELVNLDLDKINLSTSEIRVWGKGSKERMVLMGEPATQALHTYIKQGRQELLNGKRSSAVFLNRYGERLLARRVQKILEHYAKIIGKRVHPHTLRHTFATHMLDGGADLRVVQELLGHAQLSSTQIYTHVTGSQAKKIYLSAHPMARQSDDENQ